MECPELMDVFVKSTNLPRLPKSNETDIFYNSMIEYATLHVSESSIESYQNSHPWSSFGTIMADITDEEYLGPIHYLIDETNRWGYPNAWGGGMTCTLTTSPYRLTNPYTTENNWEVQFAFDVNEEFIVGKTYFLEYDIYGTERGKSFEGFLQNTDGYVDCGNFGKVDIPQSNTHMVLSATCTEAGGTRLIFSFGDYVGTIYVDYFHLYTYDTINSIESIKSDFIRNENYDIMGRRATDIKGLRISEGKIVLYK